MLDRDQGTELDRYTTNALTIERRESWGKTYIDHHFASNADLKPLIKKKELYGRPRLVINDMKRWVHTRSAKRASRHSTFFSADKIYEFA